MKRRKIKDRIWHQYFAVLSLGAIVVNLNPLYTPEELKSLIKQTGVTTLVTVDMVIPTVKSVLSEINVPKVIATSIFIFMDRVDTSTPKSLQFDNDWHHFSELLSGWHNKKRPKEVEFRNELPKSAVGKILRKILRDEELMKR